MIPKKIEGTEWTVQDWDSQWAPVYSLGEKYTIEVDSDGDACVDCEGGGSVAYVPLVVLAEILRRNGYNVSKVTSSVRSEVSGE